jgi:hypothetical protein
MKYIIFYLLIVFTFTAQSQENDTTNQTIEQSNVTISNKPIDNQNVTVPTAKTTVLINNINITHAIQSINTLDGTTLNATDAKGKLFISSYEKCVGDQINYLIELNNSEDRFPSNYSFNDIYIFYIFPKNLSFISSKTKLGILDKNKTTYGKETTIMPKTVSEKNEVVWKITSIGAGESLQINLTSTIIDLPCDIFKSRVYIIGTWKTEIGNITDVSEDVPTSLLY